MGWVNSGSAVRQAGSSWKQGNGGASRVTVLCPAREKEELRLWAARQETSGKLSQGLGMRDGRPTLNGRGLQMEAQVSIRHGLGLLRRPNSIAVLDTHSR